MYRIIALLSMAALAVAESGPGPTGVESGGSSGGSSGGGAAPAGGLDLKPLLLMAGVVAVFYFIAIRPQRKEEKRRKELVDATKPGDQVVTIGGAQGVVEKVGEAMIEVRLGTGDTSIVVPFLKSAVATNKSAEKVKPEGTK